MNDSISHHQVQRDYYKEAKQARLAPIDCPYCKRPGKFAANAYELAKRIPSVAMEGIAFCHSCKEIVVNREQSTAQQRAWYCAYCELCLCPACQKTFRHAKQ